MRTTLIIGVVAAWCASARADDTNFNVAALPGLQWWASASDSQLAQNPDGTGAVANGSPVGFISDLSGNGRNAVMGNSVLSGGDAFRPQFEANLIGSQPGILFNGSTAFSSLQSSFLNGASAATIAFAIEADNVNDSNRYFFGTGTAAVGFANSGMPFAGLQLNSSSVVNYASYVGFDGSEGIDTTEILVVRFQSGGGLDIWANGVLAGSVPATTPNQSIVSPATTILGNLNTSPTLGGFAAPNATAASFSFLEGLATTTALSDSQISQLYSYLSQKWPGVQETAFSPNLYWSSTVNPQETPPTTINAGHIQGVAAGDGLRIVFHTAVIAEYDANWNLLSSNQAIATGIVNPVPAGAGIHSGDGDYMAGKIFAPLENSLGGDGASIAVYDATKPGLPLITSKSVTDHPHEFSSLVVVPNQGTHGIIFGTAYYAALGGGQLWMYNYADGNVLSPDFGAFLGTLQLPSAVQDVQGVAWKAPYFYFSDDTLQRVLYQNGVLSSQAETVWQTPNTVQGLAFEGSNILQVLQGGSTSEGTTTLSSTHFNQITPTGFNTWNLNGNGSFSSNLAWDPALPNSPGAAALLSDGTTTRVSAGSVQMTVDGAYTVGSLSFDTTAGTSYLLAGDGQVGHGLTFDSGNSTGASLNVYSGNHSITANLYIADAGGLTVDVVAGSSLLIAGPIGERGGPRSVTIDDAGVVTLGSANHYSGGTLVRFGTLRTTANGALGTGPLTVNASSGSTSAVNIGSFESVTALSGTVQPSGAAVISINAGASLTIAQDGDTTFPGTVENSGAFVKSGAGTLELDGAPTLTAGSSLQVEGTGRLKINVTADTATVESGVVATVGDSATLELAGSVSALSSPVSAANRVRIVNNSLAPAGLLISGTNQQVGNIDGLGTTQVNAGSDLAANHIVQGALIIGGDSTHSATVTIVASNVYGSPFSTAGSAGIGSGNSSAAFVIMGPAPGVTPLAESTPDEATGSSQIVDGSLVTSQPFAAGTEDAADSFAAAATSLGSIDSFSPSLAFIGGDGVAVVPEPAALTTVTVGFGCWLAALTCRTAGVRIRRKILAC